MASHMVLTLTKQLCLRDLTDRRNENLSTPLLFIATYCVPFAKHIHLLILGLYK